MKNFFHNLFNSNKKKQEKPILENEEEKNVLELSYSGISKKDEKIIEKAIRIRKVYCCEFNFLLSFN